MTRRSGALSPSALGPKRTRLRISAVALVIAVGSLTVAIAGILSSSVTKSSSIPVDANESESLGQAPDIGESRISDPTVAPDNVPDLIELVSESAVWVNARPGQEQDGRLTPQPIPMSAHLSRMRISLSPWCWS